MEEGRGAKERHEDPDSVQKEKNAMDAKCLCGSKEKQDGFILLWPHVSVLLPTSINTKIT